MFDQEDSELNVVIGVLFGILALVIALVIGLGVYTQRAGVTTSAQEAAQDAVREAGVAVPGAEDGIVFAEVEEVGEALVKLYFEFGQSAVPGDAAGELARVVEALGARPEAQVLLSGFHDEIGSAQANAEVAKQRALAVRDALVAAGVPAERVLLRRPAVTLGGSDATEARRVEIRVQ